MLGGLRCSALELGLLLLLSSMSVVGKLIGVRSMCLTNDFKHLGLQTSEFLWPRMCSLFSGSSG